MKVLTKEAQLVSMGAQDLPQAAKELLLNDAVLITQRCKSRTAFAVEISKGLSNNPDGYAVLVPILELIGSGGSQSLGSNYGGGTTRLRIYQECGSGRVHARDGGAWDSAIAEAMVELSCGVHHHGGASITPRGWFTTVDLLVDSHGDLTLMARGELLVTLSGDTAVGEHQSLKEIDEELVMRVRALLGQALLAKSQGSCHIPLRGCDIPVEINNDVTLAMIAEAYALWCEMA